MSDVKIKYNNKEYIIDKTNLEKTKKLWLEENANVKSFFYNSISLKDSNFNFNGDTIGELYRYQTLTITNFFIEFINTLVQSYLYDYYVQEFSNIRNKWQEYYNNIISIYKNKVINLINISGYNQIISILNKYHINISFLAEDFSVIYKKKLTTINNEIQALGNNIYQILVDIGDNIDIRYILVEFFDVTNENINELIDCQIYELDRQSTNITTLIDYHTKEFKRFVQ